MNKIEKSLFMLSIIIISLLCVGAVCAADVADDTISSVDDVQVIESDNEIDEVIQEPAIVEETQAAEDEPPIAEDDTTKTFTHLIDDIGIEASEVTLDGTYKFDSSVDTAYPIIRRDLTINGPATIDGNGLTRLIAVTGGATLTLKNLNFINGATDETTLNAAAVLASGGNLDIQGCTFKNNNAYQHAGAVRVEGGSIIIKDSVFEANTAAKQGSALSAAANATGFEVINCTFKNNVGGTVGDIETACANSKIIDSKFIGSSSEGYGNILLRGANSIVKNSIFENNKAVLGGAICVYNTSSDSEIDNCTFKSNTASSDDPRALTGGSAIYIQDVDATVSNCIFDSNVASGYGQGTIFLYSTQDTASNKVISKCIFVNNSAFIGSAIASMSSNFVVENSIFLDNIVTDESFIYGIEARVIYLDDIFNNKNYTTTKNVSANNNWFGSTADNYTVGIQELDPEHSQYKGLVNFKVDNWYFLNLSKSAATASYYTLLVSLNNLFTNDTGKVTKVTDCALPDVGVTLTATVGKLTPTTATLKKGVANVKYALTASQKTGTVTASVFGVAQKLKVTKTNTAIKVSPLKKYTYNKAVDAKKNYYIYATLKDSKGNVLKNKKIKIVSKGKTYTRTTDSKGRVKLLVTYVGKGTYKQKFTFAGDNMYNGATITVKLKVIAQKVKLTAPKKTYKASKKVKKLTATLKNSKGKVIKGKKITFTVNKKKYTAKTNKKGVATVKVKLSKKKTYKVTVKFAGDKTYKKLTKKTKVVIK